MKDRKSIDKKYKWNLNDIYENYDMWESDLEKFEKLTKEVPKFKGEIKRSSEKFVELEILMEKIAKLLDRLYLYPYMLKDLDSTDEITSIKMHKDQCQSGRYGCSRRPGICIFEFYQCSSRVWD